MPATTIPSAAAAPSTAPARSPFAAIPRTAFICLGFAAGGAFVGASTARLFMLFRKCKGISPKQVSSLLLWQTTLVFGAGLGTTFLAGVLVHEDVLVIWSAYLLGLYVGFHRHGTRARKKVARYAIRMASWPEPVRRAVSALLRAKADETDDRLERALETALDDLGEGERKMPGDTVAELLGQCPDEQEFPLEQLENVLGRKVRTLKKYVKTGRLRATSRGGRFYVTVAEIKRFRENR